MPDAASSGHIDDVLDALVRVRSALTETAEDALAALPSLGDAERQRTLDRWLDTAAEVAGALAARAETTARTLAISAPPSVLARHRDARSVATEAGPR